MNGDQDAGSPVQGIREIESRVRPVYSLLGRSEAFRSEIFAGVGHVYLPEMWRQTIEWLDRHVKSAQ
jgi:hypothetical protein